MTNETGAAQSGRILRIWTPEDKAFWEAEGRAIANLNLWL
jgi:NNP family nitrate/nitrite transporter-like MFS transporter